MANTQSSISLTENGDTVSLYGESGWIDLEFEGIYAIQLEGTLGGSTTVTPWIKFGSSGSYDQPDAPGFTDGTKFVMPTHGKHFLIPGNTRVKFVVADYSGSSNLKVTRTKVA